jgi:c-di-GMP-binding flagellar brake protein YcgR
MPEYVDLRAGQRISVQIGAGSLNAAYTSVIRHVSPVSVRIDCPQRAGEMLPVNAGDDLMVMVDLQGRLYTFTARVQKVDLSDDAVVMDRPRIVQHSERRQFYRLSTNIRPRYAAVIDKDNNEKDRVEVVILDISGGGIGMRSKDPVEIGDRLRIVFTLGDDQLEADTVVLAASALEAAMPWMYRINARFMTLSRQVQERIIRFVFRQQIEFLKRGVR